MNLKFGISFHPYDPSTTIVELARVTEESGFEYVWLSDHFFLRDPLITQALVASATARVKVGTSVLNPFLRHPAVIASAVVTISEFSKGRVALGLGLGGKYELENLYCGSDLPIASSREAFMIIRRLMTGESVTYKGKVFRVKDAKLTFEADNRIPMYLGARGSKMLRLAGELSDGAITNSVSIKFIQHAKAQIEEAAKLSHRDPTQVELTLVTPLSIGTGRKACLDSLRSRCVFMAGGEHPLSMLDFYGLTFEDVKTLRETVKQGNLGKAATLVNDRVVEAFCITGTSEECISKIESLAKAGVTQVVFLPPFKVDPSVKSAFIKEAGKEIVARFSGTN